MSDALLAVFLCSALAAILGLIKPGIVKMKSRGRAVLIFGAVCVASFIGFGLTHDATHYKSQIEADKKLEAKAKAEAEDARKARLEAQAKAKAESNAKQEAEAKAEAARKARLEAESKAKQETEAKAQAKAKAEAEQKAKLEAGVKAKAKAKKARQDRIASGFSAWDGSHRKLERAIKKVMNDPDSYDHVETLYWDQGDYLIVKTTFRGKNAFGGKVLNWVKAKCDLDGNVIQVLEQGP